MTALSVHGARGRAQNPNSYTDTYGLEGRVELFTAQLARSCAGRAEHRIQMGKNMADDLRGGTYHGRMSENVRGIAETRNPRTNFSQTSSSSNRHNCVLSRPFNTSSQRQSTQIKECGSRARVRVIVGVDGPAVTRLQHAILI